MNKSQARSKIGGLMKLFKFFIVFLFSSLSVDGSYKVSFEESFLPSKFISNPNSDFFRSLYEAYDKETCMSDEYIIPKLIHFVWLGSKLPDECRKMIRTWKTMHPTWKVKVWTDTDVKTFGMQNIDAFNRASNFGQKSDIFRYEILYRHGGVYADIDFECIQPLDDLHKSCEFYTGACGDSVCLLNGLIGTRPGHPIMKACIDNLYVSIGDHNESRIMDETGPYLFTRMFLSCTSLNDAGKVVPFPPSYFYPFPGSMRDMTDKTEVKRQFLKPESLTIHYWASTWQRNKL